MVERDRAWRARVRAFAAGLGLDEAGLPLMEQALTHRSAPHAAQYGHNERLEFLGDSVLALLVNEYLYRTFPHYPEGQLTRLKARYVSAASLSPVAAARGLGSLLDMGQGDEQTGGRERLSTLSNTFEAVLGALFLTQGLDAAREFVHRELLSRVDPSAVADYKTLLQERLQEMERVTPSYVTLLAGGPSHDPLFQSEVYGGSRLLGAGTGRSKKHAEQAAAEDALANWAEVPKPDATAPSD